MSNEIQVTSNTQHLKQVFNDLLEALYPKGVQEFVEERGSQVSILKENWISRKNTAELLQVSYPTLKSWVKYGYLNSYKIGRRVYFLESEVTAMIKKFKTI